MCEQRDVGLGVEPFSTGVIPLGKICALLSLAAIWGISVPVTKLGLLSMPPLTLTALRFGIAVPVLAFLIMNMPPLPWKAVAPLALLGVVGIGIGQIAQSLGVARTPASIGTILSATIPVFVVVFATIRLKQSITRTQTLGIAVAFGGIAVVATGGPSTETAATLAGPLLVLASALAIAFYYVWSVELTHQYGSLAVAAWSTFFGFAALLPWAIWEASFTPFQLTLPAIGAATFLGLFVTVAGLLLWLNILREIPARVASSVQFLQPVFGIATSTFIFQDQIGSQFVMGVILILTGLALTVHSRRQAA
ncbi:DMT family transporter [Schlesneria sp. T3-172]|uniref:DMT family transporter n=1 Tax=Schlesneria sphaerica TaxID=3373610 RepID=UPI0037C9B0B7